MLSEEEFEEFRKRAEKHERRVKIAAEAIGIVISIITSVITAVIIVLLCTS